MSWRTSSLALALRSIGRRCGINALIMSLRGPSSYESGFNDGMLACVRAGDVVWDVGANMGIYTKQFSRLVGPMGKVFAFEPSPENILRLAANVKENENTVLLPCGLGDREDVVSFVQGADALGATSQVWGAPSDQGEKIPIRIADHVAASGDAIAPNFVKIDVEGFELEVLRGMNGLLRDPKLRGLGVEIHFGLLASRGMELAPQQIEALLASAGFACSWPDSSHLLAVRSS